MKKLISAGMCAALLASLAGCAAGKPADTIQPAASTQMGRWVETSLDLGGEELINNPSQLADGSVVFYTAAVSADGMLESYTRHSSTDGTNWTTEPVSFETEGQVSSITAASDGTLALISYEETEDGGANLHLYLQSTDGAPEEVQDDSVDGIYSSSLMFAGDNLDYLSISRNGDNVNMDLVQLNMADKSVTKTTLPQNQVSNPNSISTAGDQLVYMNYSETGDMILYSLNAATGESTELLNPVPNAVSTHALVGDADGAVYYPGEDGIYRLAPGGTLPEQVMPADGMALSISSNYPYSICRTTAGEFILALMGDSGGTALYRYYYDETLPTHAETTLTVWSLSDSATARAAVNAYKKTNPDVDVNFEIAMQDDSDDGYTARNDALTQLNTQLLAGEGPDLLILDDTDYAAYINKGMLADLSDVVPLDELQSNIINPFVQDGKAYVLPARFSVPALCGDSGTLDTLTDLASMQQAVLDAAPRQDLSIDDDDYYTALPDDEKYALALTSGKEFARFILPTSANAILHDGTLDADALTQAFDFVKATADYYNIASYQNTNADYVSAQSYGNADIIMTDPSQSEYTSADHAKYGWLSVDTPYAVIAMARTGDALDANAGCIPVDMVPRPGLTTGAYNPGTLVAVNANSKQQDAAKALAAAFFSAEVQDQFCSDGTAVRAASLQAKLEATKAMVAGSQPGKSTGAYTGDLDAFYAQCSSPVIVPALLNKSFGEHAQAIIDGSEDVAAAVSGVQNDLSLYLAEQQ